MYLNIITLPLTFVLIISLLGRYIGNKGLLKLVKLIMTILISLVGLLIYENFMDNIILKINLFNNISCDLFDINYYLYFDDVTSLMLSIIIIITYIVLIYSYDYMIEDPHIIRFYLFIILFILFMIILITTNSLPILFIGWEGVGISSFLLISFWYTRFQAQLGALLALIMNRVGDILFLLGIFLSLNLLGSLDIISLSINPYINWDYILISFFIAAMAKSAQLYLHIWLPYSMEGPTPISALIHAATMVTAGIYLLLKLNQIIISSYYTLIIIILIGGLTAFIGGTLAIVSFDIKELIAYSTMSQLGYMITILGIKGNNLGYYHLIFHAYFKALLFLTAGGIIHTIIDIQDFRKIGGLFKLLPVQLILSIIGLSSLIALPFSTGFYSKELILNNSYSVNNYLSQFIYLILLISALLTILYSINFIYIIFIKNTKLSIFQLKNLHFFSLHLLIPLVILSIITIFVGYILSRWIHINNLFNIPFSFNVPLYIKSIPLIFIFLSLIIIKYLYFNFTFLYKQYSFKLIYKFISGYIFSISYRVFFKLFDYGFLDLLGPLTINYINKISNKSFKYNINLIILLLTIFIIYIIF